RHFPSFPTRRSSDLGTIRAAGQEVGWSYRTCLNRLREMEQVLGSKVLETKRGGASRGGARLTPAARRLVKLFASWRGAATRSSEDRKSTRLNSSHRT